MVALSVNINKVAWLRNSRDGDIPSPIAAMKEIIASGADGITIHPRPDERHITHADTLSIANEWRQTKNIELNIEGFPDDRWLALLENIKPNQATLVPDSPTQKTSDHGYRLAHQMTAMTQLVKKIKSFAGIRVAIFIDGDGNGDEIKRVRDIGADRVEFYTGPYAHAFAKKKGDAILQNYVANSQTAINCHLGINAGHDLNLNNLPDLVRALPQLDEVSIGHALIADALWFGFNHTIKKYQNAIAK
ncbi:MAG: pyridoxine 5'-phosphate synthase [Alphaproteobacteria bacterium]